MWQKPDEYIVADNLEDVVRLVIDDETREKMIECAKNQGQLEQVDDSAIWCFSAVSGADLFQINSYVDEFLLQEHRLALEHSGRDVNYVGIVNKSLYGMNVVVRRPCERLKQEGRDK